MGEGAFDLLTGDNKELLIVPGASHTDLYDGGDSNAIPFEHDRAVLRLAPGSGAWLIPCNATRTVSV